MGGKEELLHFHAQAGDHALNDHVLNFKHNTRYTSHVVQNELIIICGDLIRAKLLRDIRTAHFFSVIGNEVTDSAGVEQLSLSIRFLHNNPLCAKFIGFLKCDAGTTGEAIANMILTKREEWQLEPQLLRGQAYDRAGAMAGLYNERYCCSYTCKVPQSHLHTQCFAQTESLYCEKL